MLVDAYRVEQTQRPLFGFGDATVPVTLNKIGKLQHLHCSRENVVVCAESRGAVVDGTYYPWRCFMLLKGGATYELNRRSADQVRELMGGCREKV